MRHWIVLLSLLMTLSACGGRKSNVSIPITTQPISTTVAKSELEGLASYYAEPYHGRKTANGETFDTYNAMTAAHRTLPVNTMVRVTNKTNGESVDVRINDRGPFVDGRVIDLSLIAAQKIELVRPGVAPVKLTILKEGDGGRDGVPTSGYAVQVGAFSSRESAEELKKRLDKNFQGVSIQSVPGDTPLFRVRVGPEPDMESAQKLASQLRKHDLNPFVVREQ